LLLATQVERNRLRESETRLKLATEVAKLGIFAWDTVSISVDDTNTRDGITLVVQDDGVGIAADALPKVFDAFFSTRSGVGTGIGLFIAKQFVEGHGGHIEMKSSNDAEHHGTAVDVFLPLHTAYDASLTSSPARP
jgi:signal transduction histidine kinase